ncbi:MAG: hypothetical protein KJ063_18345 [Anaerolineae bacterium]|nr:hypothetical protein [Anaerolineae bacterium]
MSAEDSVTHKLASPKRLPTYIWLVGAAAEFKIGGFPVALVGVAVLFPVTIRH